MERLHRTTLINAVANNMYKAHIPLLKLAGSDIVKAVVKDKAKNTIFTGSSNKDLMTKGNVAFLSMNSFSRKAIRISTNGNVILI